MKLKLLSMMLACSLLTIKAMDTPVTFIYQTYENRGHITLITAILQYSKQPKDWYKCELSYNSQRHEYQGKYHYNGIGEDTWHVAYFDSKLAQSYFETLLEIVRSMQGKKKV